MQNAAHTTLELKTEERQRCEVWTRVMGYHRPVSQFNLGKKSEHYERRHFNEENTMSSRYAQKNLQYC